MMNVFRIVILLLATFVASVLLPIKSAIAAELCSGILLEQHEITAQVKAYDASQSYSQKIRDNTEDYWDFVRKYSSPTLDALKVYEGLVPGDNHAGNFIIGLLNGRLHYFLADIKDAGRAPYIWDIARNIVNTDGVVSKEVDIKFKALARTILDAYILGLSGKRMAVPATMAVPFETSRTSFLASYHEYIAGKIKKGRLKIKPGKLELLPDTPEMNATKQDMEVFLYNHFPKAEVIDFAVRPRERGGSKERMRFWALLKEDGAYDIVEFKEIGPPAVEKYKKQAPPEERYEEVMDTFWPDRDHFYQFVRLNGKPFETRRKKVDLMSVPYKQRTAEDLQLLLDMDSYAANETGLLHAKTMQNTDYLNAINKNFPGLIDALKKFNKDYKTHLETAIKDLNTNRSEEGDE